LSKGRTPRAVAAPVPRRRAGDGPAGKHAARRAQGPLAFADALDEDWISLTTGAAMLQKLQQAALAANRPLKLRMRDPLAGLKVLELGQLIAGPSPPRRWPTSAPTSSRSSRPAPATRCANGAC
jgi:hypothetical protein